ncbi:MAG: hypothetical protein AMXMBFR12_07900 [Candidatus Babeliales bacterium]
MKLHFIFLLSLTISATNSLERFAPLPALPLANEGVLISFEQLPNPIEPAPMMPLRLWQKPQDKARLELPLVEAKIRSLEKKHDKEKKAFNEKRETIVNRGMFALGCIAVCYFINKFVKDQGKSLSVLNYPGDFFFRGITTHFLEKPLSFFEQAVNNSIEYGFVFSGLLGLKYSAHTLWQLPHLFKTPKESSELLAACQERAQLLLTLQQPEQAQSQN